MSRRRAQGDDSGQASTGQSHVGHWRLTRGAAVPGRRPHEPMHDIATFLSEHEPFRGLEPQTVGDVAARVEIEYFGAGQTVFDQGETPEERVRMVRVGSVDLLDEDRALDLLGPGELFGHPSMLAGAPTGLTVRAHEDTLCYRLPSELLVPLLTRPEGLRYVARSLLSRRPRRDGAAPAEVLDPSRRPIVAFMREALVRCRPDESVREVARRMVDDGASSAIVELDDGELGIVTDQDLRVRVVAGDVGRDAPIARAMTAPAFTAGASEMAADVMVDMINRGIRHVPVLSPRRQVLGVVCDIDLLAAETRTPFMVRRRIARASSTDELELVARDLRRTVIALHDAEIPPAQLCAIIAAFADALARRALQLLCDAEPDLPVLAWYATGSIGRREAFPSSDVDSAMAWHPEADPARLRALAQAVLELLERCGFARDPHAATAADTLFARSRDDWQRAIRRWLDQPEDPRLLVVVSMLADRHRVHETGTIADAFADLGQGQRHPLFMGQMRRLALMHRPPTGFLRDIVVEHSGEHRGRLDIKRGGFLPIVDLARYLAMANGVDATSTLDRLRAAADLGVLPVDDAGSLQEAFRLFLELRMDHQVEQLRHGRSPTDFIEPADLDPLTRRYLREAFRAIARTQRALPSHALRG